MDFSSHQEHIQHKFDSFCKKVVRNEARTDQTKKQRRRDRERLFSELTVKEYASLAATDDYPSGQSRFNVAGYVVTVQHGKLAEAIATLPQDKRDVVLLAYFLRMTDEEVASRLNLIRPTVWYKRTCSLQEMKTFMESED